MKSAPFGPMLALLALVTLLAIAGCGDDSNGRSSVLPSATPTEAATNTPTATSTPVVGARAWAVADQQIVRSEDGGFTWSAPLFSSSDVFLKGITFVDRETGWAVGGSDFGSGAALLHTIDGGATWTSQLDNVTGVPRPADTQFSFFDVTFTTAQHGVAVGAAQQGVANYGPPPLIVVTEDGGTNWHAAQGLPSFPGILRSVCINATGVGIAVGYAAVSRGMVLVTTDGGTSWTDVSVSGGLAGGDTTVISSAACAPPGQFWISGVNIGFRGAGTRTDLRYSPDGGATWTDRTPEIGNVSGSTFQVLPLSFVGAEMGWAIPAPRLVVGGLGIPGTSPFVLRTTDAGEHWVQQPVPEGFNGALNALAFADDQRGVAVGAALNSDLSPTAAAIATDDGGRTWHVASFAAGVGQLLDVTIVP